MAAGAPSAAAAMAAAIEADGGAGLPGGDGVVPGTEGVPPVAAPPAAGPSTTDTGAGTGTPETIPYTRFKEVNDQYNELKDLKPLVDYGYDSDSLGQLAAFHQAYSSDPVGTWASMADNLDLPQEVKDAIAAHVAASDSPGSAQGEPSGTGNVPTAELPEEVRRSLEYVEQLREREADTARQQMLDRVTGHWDALDKQDGVQTSESMKLNMIAALGASGRQFATVEDLAKAGRELVAEHNATVLGGAVQSRSTGTPLSVPGSAPAPGAAPIKFGNIREASRAAEEAIKRGELPTLR